MIAASGDLGLLYYAVAYSVSALFFFPASVLTLAAGYLFGECEPVPHYVSASLLPSRGLPGCISVGAGVLQQNMPVARLICIFQFEVPREFIYFSSLTT